MGLHFTRLPGGTIAIAKTGRSYADSSEATVGPDYITGDAQLVKEVIGRDVGLVDAYKKLDESLRKQGK